MSDRWDGVDRLSARTRLRVGRLRRLLPSLEITDATALTAEPVYAAGSHVWTENAGGLRRRWLVAADGSLAETGESQAWTAVWVAERAAGGEGA